MGAMLDACSDARAPSIEASSATPVVVIVIDTLRADHLSCYGYGFQTSPVLDAFAAQATLFERNTTQCNATFPSITSILTGLYPKTHRNYLAVPVEGMAEAASEAACLAERFHSAGYQTLAVIAHPSWFAIGANSVVRHGWDEISILDDKVPVLERVRLADAAHTNARLFPLLDRLPAQSDGKPLFLWVHYFDPHTDLPNVYDAPESTRNMWLAEHLEAVGAGAYREALAALPPADRRTWIEANVPVERQNDVALANGCSLYDAEIRSCDAEIGKLFERLERMGLWDPALIVVMADHGENLESAALGHGPLAFTHKKIYESVAHTPLIVKLPGQRVGRRIDVLTQNIDLVPTLVDLLSFPADPRVEGKSLAPLLEGGNEAIHETVFIESSDCVDRAVKTSSLKYIDRGEDQDPLVFDWRADPEERVNLLQELDGARIEELQAAMAEFRPIEVLHVDLAPGERPWTVEIELELSRSVVDRVNGVAPETLVPEGHRWVWKGTVGEGGVQAALTLRRRNTEMHWRIRRADGRAPAETVFLGRTPLPRTTAIPLWRPGVGDAPALPSFELWYDPDGKELALAMTSPCEASFEVELRFASPDYLKNVRVLESSGLGPLEERRSRVFQLEGKGQHVSARFERTATADALYVQARIDGAWPELASVCVDGAPLRTDELAFVLPYPLDGRITTDLLSGAAEPAPPGTISIWLESASAAGRIDASRLHPEHARLIEQMGYLEDGTERAR